MTLPLDLLSLSSAEGARRVALELLDQARAALERRLDPLDAEALHDFRVAIRRLRSTLRAWRTELDGSVRHKDRRKLGTIQTATGAGRDAEVGLAWLADQAASLDAAQHAGCQWIVSRLEQQLERSRMRKSVRRNFATLERRLRPRLELMRVEVNLTQPLPVERFGAAWAARVHEHARELGQRMASVDAPSNRAAAHAARIQLKRLRYLAAAAEGSVAGVALLILNCKRLQDSLGALNDAHVLSAELEAALQGCNADESNEPRAPARFGVLELIQRLEARREQLFLELEREWLGAGCAALIASAEAVAHAAELAARADMEIERKFLLSGLPRLPQGFSSHEIEQGWLPGKELRERIRRVIDAQGTRYYRTIKLGRGITRTEVEEQTTREIFDVLWPLTVGCRVHKHRYKVTEGELVWEIDEFKGRELFLAEVELRDAATAVTPPAWLAPWIVREVTDEKGFTNLELATFDSGVS